MDRKWILLLLLPLCFWAYAEEAASEKPKPLEIKAGVQYEEVVAKSPATTSGTDPLVIPGKITVTEFFSPGCPGCYHAEPQLEAWLQKLPPNVEFQRIPVDFHANWGILAKGYYTAVALNQQEKITAALFKAIHEEHKVFTTRDQMQQFFIENGIQKQDFDATFDFSPGIDAQLLRGRELMMNYQILRIPTIIINGRYKTDPKLAGGEKEWISVVNYLIDKEKNANPPK